MKYLSKEGDSISHILLNEYGRNDDILECALYKLNPHLVNYGPILPAEVEIKLPTPPKSETKKVINIWD